MASEYALTSIKHGNPDGTLIEYEAGEKISAKDFDKEVLDSLREAGAIGVPPVEALTALSTENEELVEAINQRDARIAELEAAITAASAK